MTPEVLLRKLNHLRQLLSDLAPFKDAKLSKVQDEHYKIERLFELLVMTASDILFHKLSEQGLTPESYRDAFKLAGAQGLIPLELAERLQEGDAKCHRSLVHRL
jgi:uncharacterized protein YutE (UPF0331/DUF86 family)